MSVQYFLLLAVLSRLVSSSNDCDACLEGVCYSKTAILNGYRLSGQLAVDRTENVVYFHYEDNQSTDFTASFDLDDIRLKIIPNIDFSFARAVDQINRYVYIGGARGIYKYDPNTNITSEYGLFDKIIWHMQFTNKIYYTVFQTKGIYVLENKKSNIVSGLSNYTIDDFVIDNKGDFYFLSQSKVYRMNKGGNQPTVIANDMYSLSVDNFGTAHFVHYAKRGLYKLDPQGDLYEVGVFGSGLPLNSVFDKNNNIIYHEINSQKLHYLMPNYGRCVVSRKFPGLGKHKKFARDENEVGAEVVIHRIDSIIK